MISMLNQATNGNDLLAILDTLTEDVSVESDTQPTLETIDFWLECATSWTGTVCSQSRGCCAILNKSTKQIHQMTFDRAQLVEDYIQQLIEGMDYKTMECLVYDTLKDNLSDYTDEQLITEVEEYNPELLQDVPVA